MHGQVALLQLVLSIFWVESDNNKQDCCRQALFFFGNLLYASNDTQSGCVLSSCCGMMRNNANAFGNCVPGYRISISRTSLAIKDSLIDRV